MKDYTEEDILAVEKAVSDYAKSYPLGQMKQDLPQLYAWFMDGVKE